LPGPDRVDLAREAIDVARRSGDNDALTWASGVAVRALGDEGQYDEATRQLDELRSLIGADSRPMGRSTLLLGEADLFLLTGHHANAVKAATVALALMAEEFDEQNALLSLIALGATSLAVPDLDAAYDAYARVFEISRRVSDIGSQGIALSGLAAIAAQRSQFETSARVLGTALAIPRSPGARPTNRYGYELAERLDRDALGDRYDQFLADGAVLAPDEAAALVGIYH
jgi:tetratricopeptide (TPR) repeat protein